jgi:aminopeptidase-like protein
MGEAELLARLAAARGWHRVDVVTSQYHVVRARLLIARCYRGQLRVVGAHDTFWDVVINAALESGKLVYHELVHRGC